MDLELRGQEAETSCDQECGAQDQKGPEENSGVREPASHCLGGRDVAKFSTSLFSFLL